jgi:hypothetical protein
MDESSDSPLLAEPSTVRDSASRSHSLSGFRERKANHWAVSKIAASCVAINFLQLLSEFLMLAPRLRLLELTICRNYYREFDESKIDEHGYVGEELCKLNRIQASVATLRGWQLSLSAIPC